MSSFGSGLWDTSLWGGSSFIQPGVGVQAGEVMIAARTHLDDDDSHNWPDNRLFPKLQEAHRHLQIQLVLNGVPVINQVSIVLLVPAHTVDLSIVSGYPNNMVSPLWLKERAVGQRDDDFVNMVEVDFIPQAQPSTELIWWCYQGNTINLLESINDREVQLRYRKGLTIPLEATDPIGVILGEGFLSYKTAALALNSLSGPNRDPKKIEYLNQEAESNLLSLLASAAGEAQNLPAKRRPYHRGRGRSRVLRDI